MMTEAVVCLDAGVWIKYFVPEDPVELRVAARQLVRRAVDTGQLVAPAFAWTEFGTVLRKLVRRGLIVSDEAEGAWVTFRSMPIRYVDTPLLRNRAWEIARQFNLLTLYDAAYLAAVEVAIAPADTPREFWTVDEQLLRDLDPGRPPYVYQLA